MVANKIPKMIGTGRKKRAASIKERICVLSPISATPTTMVDTKKASTGFCRGRAGDKPWHGAHRPTRVPGTDTKGLAKRIGSPVRWPKAKRVDTGPAMKAGGYSPMTGDF